MLLSPPLPLSLPPPSMLLLLLQTDNFKRPSWTYLLVGWMMIPHYVKNKIMLREFNSTIIQTPIFTDNSIIALYKCGFNKQHIYLILIISFFRLKDVHQTQTHKHIGRERDLHIVNFNGGCDQHCNIKVTKNHQYVKMT